MLLGAETANKWVVLVVLAGVEGAPHELLVTALVRARACELLAPGDDRDEVDAHFTVGLFSALDAMMDSTMAEAVGCLPLREDIAEALVAGTGAKAAVLRAVVAHERGENGDGLASFADADAVNDAYLEAVAWADDAGRALR